MSDIMEGQCGDIIGLACLDQLIVFEEVLFLGVVGIGLFLEDALGLRSGIVHMRLSCGMEAWDGLRRDVLELHRNVQRLTCGSRKFITGC